MTGPPVLLDSAAEKTARSARLGRATSGSAGGT